MEPGPPNDPNTAQSYSPHLKTVLKTYQLSAVKSLQGPSSALLGVDRKGLLQDQANFRYSPPACTGNCVLDNPPKHVSIKEFEKRVESPVPEPITCKPLFVAKQPNDDSDDDLPERLRVCERRDLEFQIPILTTSDQVWSEHETTLLEGEKISCFVVGGEKRLCLPQILNTVLLGFALNAINQVCDDLKIFCSRCTRDQLEELKLSGILPTGAASCGLITQTDAERLVGALLWRTEAYLTPAYHEYLFNDKQRMLDKKQHHDGKSISQFKVYHECFGKCKGIFHAELFTSEDSACIECSVCHLRFSPPHFVRHAHGPVENSTCHWGFDSTKWRKYLLLSRDQQHYTKLANFFEELKEKHIVPNSKRKHDAISDIQESEKLMKKMRKDIARDEFAANMYNGSGMGFYHPATAAGFNESYMRMHWAMFEFAARESSSAFKPWNPVGFCKHREGSSSLVPPYLSRGPPVLQHPERVVPMSEYERFEPHFQPNVALAPIPAPAAPPSPIVARPASPAYPPHHPPHHNRHHRRYSRPNSPDATKATASIKIELPPSPPPQPELEEEEEEESSAAVTSSTSAAEQQPRTELGISSSPECCNPAATRTTSTIVCTAALDLEERLHAINAPQDVIDLWRRINAEHNSATCRAAALTQENALLRNELRLLRLQILPQPQQNESATEIPVEVESKADNNCQTADNKSETADSTNEQQQQQSSERVEELKRGSSESPKDTTPMSCD